MTNHLARHELERLAADDPASRIPPQLRVHIACCDACRTRLRAFYTARSKFLAGQPPNHFARDTLAFAGPPEPVAEPRDWARDFRNVAIVGLLAYFLGTSFWYGHEAAASWSRVQASASVKVLATRHGLETRLRDGDALSPGEELEFEYSLTRARYVLLLGVDDTGRVRKYFPTLETSAADALLVPTTKSRLPPIAVEDRGGEERLYALFAEGPIIESAARQAVSQAAGAAWAAGDRLAKMPNLNLPVQTFSMWFRRNL
jgi:hypothetical protein